MRSSRPSTTTSTSVPAFSPAASAAALGTRSPRLLPHLASLTFITFAPFGYTMYIRTPGLSTYVVSGTAGVPPALSSFQNNKKKERAGGTPAVRPLHPHPPPRNRYDAGARQLDEAQRQHSVGVLAD